MSRSSGDRLRPELALDLEILDNRLDHPIAIRKLRHARIEAICLDQPLSIGSKRRWQFPFRRAVDSALRSLRKIEKKNGNTGVREMSRNAGTHRSRAKNSNTTKWNHEQFRNLE